MKKLMILMFAVVAMAGITGNVFAQVLNEPMSGMNYQTVVRDASGNIYANKPVTINFKIVDANGNVLYVDNPHIMMTNKFGLVNTTIGKTTTTALVNMDWSAPRLVVVEVDINNDGVVDITNTSRLEASPYAIYAMQAEKLTGPNDTDTTNELQTLSLTGNMLSISGGNAVPLPVGSIGSIVNAGSGLTMDTATNTVMLGGLLSQNTIIDGNGNAGLILDDLSHLSFETSGNMNVDADGINMSASDIGIVSSDQISIGAGQELVLGGRNLYLNSSMIGNVNVSSGFVNLNVFRSLTMNADSMSVTTGSIVMNIGALQSWSQTTSLHSSVHTSLSSGGDIEMQAQGDMEVQVDRFYLRGFDDSEIFSDEDLEIEAEELTLKGEDEVDIVTPDFDVMAGTIFLGSTSGVAVKITNINGNSKVTVDNHLELMYPSLAAALADNKGPGDVYFLPDGILRIIP